MNTTLPGTPVLIRSMAIALVAGGLVALPATSWPAPNPEPVTPEIESIPVEGVDADSVDETPVPTDQDSHSADTDHSDKPLKPAVVTDKVETDTEFGLVGVTFDEAPPADAHVQVRVKEADGWAGWVDLHLSPGHGPDQGDPDYDKVKPTTEPLLTDPATEVQVRIDTPKGKPPVGTEIKVVSTEEAPADAGVIASTSRLASANAATAQPPIITRAGWGANERLRGGCPGLTDAHKVAFVHHTASSSNYTPEQAPAQLRAIYGWATSNGYCDMPYNYLVDRYGNIYEGRGGGIGLPVKSGATASFNNSSVAVSALGNFQTTPSNGFSAMNTSIARLIGWVLALTNRPANGQEYLTAEGYRGGAPRGEVRLFNRISGHRNAFNTSCPGDALYPLLPAMRVEATGYQDGVAGAPAAAPVISSSVITPWAKRSRAIRKKYYRSSFKITPGESRMVRVKRKKFGKRWPNGKKWKFVKTLATDATGYAPFALKARKRTNAYKLVAPKTATATKARNKPMRLRRR